MAYVNGPIEEGWSANTTGEEVYEYIYSINPTDMRINEYYIKVRMEALPLWEWGSCIWNRLMHRLGVKSNYWTFTQ